MKLIFYLCLGTVLSLLVTKNGYAQFLGDFAPENWSFSSENTDGMVNTDNAPEAITLTGGDDGSQGNTDYTITIDGDKVITFNWSYTTEDDPAFDPAGWLLNGNFIELIDEEGLNDQNGTVLASLTSGDVFGFRVHTVDGIFDPGILTVSNFQAIDPVIIYVDSEAGGANNGTSWTNAFNDLTDALNAAEDLNQVWVADRLDGYKPGGSTPDISSTFTIDQTGLQLYGGFAGTENGLGERVPESLTLLSGDIGEPGSTNDNVNNVVTITAEAGLAIIDGFVISAGNGSGDETGGGIRCLSSLEISHSYIESNRSGQGGGIYFSTEAGNLTIEDVNFIDNTSADQGGAVYFNSTGTLSISGSSFDENTANGIGGGIYITNGELLVETTEFSSNQAAGSGAAIYFSHGDVMDTDLTIDMGTFASNSSVNHDGGAIYFSSSGTLEIRNSDFEGNSTNSENVGGAIFLADGNARITTTGFTANSASDGGAIYVSQEGINEVGLTIFEGTFNENNADNGGGAIYFDSEGTLVIVALLEVVPSSFEENSSSEGNGGAIFMNRGHATIVDTKFLSNEAGQGGAIFVASGNQSELDIESATFESNTTFTDGGAIHFNSLGMMSLVDVDFETNSSGEGDGGAIYGNNGTLVIGATDFDNNTAAFGNGGAIYLTDAGNGEASLTISGSSFADNSAGSYGGGVYFISEGMLSIENSTFNSNSTEEWNGGAIYRNDGFSDIQSTDFTENTASNGGAIYLGSGGEMEIEETDFNLNNAENNGGGVSSRGTLSLLNAEFDQNGSGRFGGAIHAFDASSAIESTVFTNNETEETGGAIHASSEGGEMSLMVVGSTFSDNQTNAEPGAGLGGGAIHASYINLELVGNDFIDNTTSNNGGAIDHSGNNNLRIDQCFFSGNSADEGGGVASESMTASITNSTFTENEATDGGGLTLLNDGLATQLEIGNCTFTLNTADGDGGAIHWANPFMESQANIFHVTIFNNTATSVGGGISISDDSEATLNLSNTIIAGNMSTGGNTPDIGLVDEEGPLSVEINSFGHNLIGDLGAFEFGTNTTGDQYGDTQNTTEPNEGAIESATAIDPLLEALADNLADIPTNALLAGSPAINAGSIVQIGGEDLLNDQRGFAYIGTPDIGSFEYYLNLAPVLDNDQNPSFTSINEDDNETPGDPLDNLEEGLITDDDGPGKGVAITAVDASGGNWQYSLDNGANWTDLGVPSLSAAILLPVDDQTRIRLQPNANFNGTIGTAVTFKAWDQAEGTIGGTLDVSNFNPAASFSQDSETISITVNPVNDLPVLENPIGDQETGPGAFTFTFAENVFNDIEDGTNLTYSASGMPSWLSFDPPTRTFSGTASAGVSTITVTATDNNSGSVTDEFNLTVTPTEDPTEPTDPDPEENPVLGLDDPLASHLIIYPTPTDGNFNLAIESDYFGQINISIMDQLGRNAFSQSLPKTESKLTAHFRLDQLDWGVYLIRIEMGDQTSVRRFIKN